MFREPPPGRVTAPGWFGGQWIDGGVLTNPTAGTILVDTGPLVGGIYEVIIHPSTSGTLTNRQFRVQHREKGNARTLAEIYFGQHTQRENERQIGRIKIEDGQRIRILARINITAVVHVAIVYWRVYPLKVGD